MSHILFDRHVTIRTISCLFPFPRVFLEYRSVCTYVLYILTVQITDYIVGAVDKKWGKLENCFSILQELFELVLG